MAKTFPYIVGKWLPTDQKFFNQCGFSCAVWAKKAEHLSLLHGERNVEHAVPAAVILCDVRKRDHAHKYSSL